MAPVTPDRNRYLVSLTEELSAQSTRVRDLIGSRHWLSDGHHKEYVLGSVLRRHLPAGILLGRGFVISPTDSAQCSSEQDLLVVDCTREAPIFDQGGLIIVFPNQVLAAVSVKTTLGPSEVATSVEGLNSVRSLVNLASPDSSDFWCGIYCFEVNQAVSKNPHLPCKYLSDAFAKYPVRVSPLSTHHHIPGPDLLCASQDVVYKVQPREADGTPRIVGLSCNGLATAVFLGNLLDHLARCRGGGGSDVASFVDGLQLKPI